MKFKLFLTIVILTTIHQSFSMTPDEQQNINAQLLEAAKQGNNAQVASLLQAGADINAKSNNGRTPLHLAAFNGHTATVELLLSHGADIKAKDGWGSTPLHLAAVFVRNATVELLEGYPALLEQAKNPTKVLLKVAIEHGYYCLVKLLLQRGVKPDVSDLQLAKAKWQTVRFKESYKAIGHLLVKYFQLTGELKAPEYSENAIIMSYLKWLMSYLSTPRASTQGPISKAGIVGLYGLPEDIAQEIAKFIQ